MKSVFIILSTTHIGGAEIRFAGLCDYFFKKNDAASPKVFLIVNPALNERLIEAGILRMGHPAILVEQLTEKNFLTYRSNLKKAIKKYAKKNDIIHFIGFSPLLRPRSMKSLLSITHSNLNIGGVKQKYFIYLSALLADSIDVLDKEIFKKIKNIFFWKSKKIYLTSNSFCDPDLYKPVPIEEKKNWIVFLGRFTPVKQVEKLMTLLPLISEQLKDKMNIKPTFFFLGHGELEDTLLQIKQHDAFKNIDIEMYYEKKPYKILNQSRIFLSLQFHNNYPSRSLLEAMAAGNIPLVTDIGDTRSVAKPEFSYYVPENFVAEDLSREIIKIFELSDAERNEKIQLARYFIIAEHTVEKMKSYYEWIYKNM